MATRLLSASKSLDAPVFWFFGDSNKRGSASDQASLSYTQDPLVQAINASGVFAEYTPLTFAGLSNGSNHGNIGSEMEFSRRFRLANPNKECWIAKYGASGSGASKLVTGTFTGSISGNVLTVTAGSVTIGDLIYASGIPAGVYVQSGSGPYNLAQCTQQAVPYLGDADVAVNLSISSTTISKANAYLTFGPADGKNFYNAYRSLVQAFAALALAGKRPYLAGVFVGLGANDSSDATASNAFGSSLAAIYRSVKSLPYWDPRTIFVLDRVPTSGGGANVATCRTGAATFKGQYRDVRMLDCDAFSKNGGDAIHYDLAGLISVGSGEYDLWSGASAGL